MAGFVFLNTEDNTLWTVGFYGPDGRWEPEGDYGTQDEAAQRVHWLNGGCNGQCGGAK